MSWDPPEGDRSKMVRIEVPVPETIGRVKEKLEAAEALLERAARLVGLQSGSKELYDEGNDWLTDYRKMKGEG